MRALADQTCVDSSATSAIHTRSCAGSKPSKAEASASSEIWGLLKRPDEKWITERAYENPKFVEDLVRDVALRLNVQAAIGRYRVEVENFESIHNHSAFAVIER